MSVDFTKQLQAGMDYLHKQGAFLTVKCGNKVNTMTISWGNVGFEWGKPIFTVLVRHSRYTHELIEKANEFTISIPFHKDLNKALTVCGTLTGRNSDKIKETGLSVKPSNKIETPVVLGCNLYYECRIVYKHEIDKESLSEEIRKGVYSDNDYHTICYGEIVDCYTE